MMRVQVIHLNLKLTGEIVYVFKKCAYLRSRSQNLILNQTILLCATSITCISKIITTNPGT